MPIAYPPVNLTESVISAGAPNTLQKTVCLVSYGATNLAVGTRKLVTQAADITGNLPNDSWLIAAVNTFFGQGVASFYVLELGTTGSNVTATATAALGEPYEVSSIAVHTGAGGSGWVVGDEFTFPGGTGIVTTVSSGAVTAVSLLTHPAQTTTPAGSAIAATAVSPSVGTGLELDVTATSSVAAFSVSVHGNGYSSAPSVTITGGGGTSATAQATVSNGTVTGINLLSSTADFTSAPTVTIAPPPANVSAQLQDYIQTAQLQNYLYVLDATVSQDSGIQTMLANYDNLTSYTYFLLTVPAALAATYGKHKAAILFVPALNAPTTEFGAAAVAFMFASLTPSLVSKIKSFNYRFVYGVTIYAQASDPVLTPLTETNANLVIPAIAGGLPNNMLLGGQTADGNAINLWYGPDYASLNVTQALNNEIITGSNDSANPLVYDQQGINRLLARATAALNTAVAVGAILGPFQISAVDFATYVTDNPSDYQTGTYNGLSFTITPARGFNNLTYGMSVDFTAASVVATAQ